jgi:hypothetical protein
MLWPLVLPFKITLWSLIAIVVVATIVAPQLKWTRATAFLTSATLAAIAFIPSCTGIMYLVDQTRFGYFEYPLFDDVKDFRAERYLPTAATQIKMHKHANGYRAQYKITDADFHAYLDRLWKQYGQYSSVKRGEMSGEGSPVSVEEFDLVFTGLDWTCPSGAIEYYGPSEADGGGATYYFDASAGVVYQRTGYW